MLHDIRKPQYNCGKYTEEKTPSHYNPTSVFVPGLSFPAVWSADGASILLWVRAASISADPQLLVVFVCQKGVIV
jgi:hypothetical protein